jgi:hypothetical protein
MVGSTHAHTHTLSLSLSLSLSLPLSPSLSLSLSLTHTRTHTHTQVGSLIGGVLRKHSGEVVRTLALELQTAGDVHSAKVKTGVLRSELQQSFDRWIDLSQVSLTL